MHILYEPAGYRLPSGIERKPGDSNVFPGDEEVRVEHSSVPARPERVRAGNTLPFSAT